MNRLPSVRSIVAALLFVCCLPSAARGQAGAVTELVGLNYLTPAELDAALGMDVAENGLRSLRLDPGDAGSAVMLRVNPATNQLLVSGPSALVTQARELIALVDVAPRQIIVEVQIVEISADRSSDIGLDWQNLLDRTHVGARLSADRLTSSQTDTQTDTDRTTERDTETERTSTHRDLTINAALPVGEFVRLIQESGAGTVRNAPRIVTINNEEGSILDGARINYVSSLSTYANIFETQELSTGLALSVTPSLGESGFIKMRVTAKLTALGEVIANSPSEIGQILENTVIVRDGETFLLGGLKVTEQRKIRRRTPILGTIFPFLFSRHVNVDVEKDVLVLLTPRVIDLASAPYELPEDLR